ncbi:MAG: nitronate monooxygenase [Thermoflexales bacterium]
MAARTLWIKVNIPKFNTPLTRLLHIDIPLVQAPMGNAASPELAAAVCNAGGLGMISVGWRDADAVRKVIGEVRALTDRLFGVNLVLNAPQDERLKICLDVGIKIVSFFWGDPTPYVNVVHDAGGLMFQTVADAAEARRVSEAGADILVAQGWEAGGNVWGTVATLLLSGLPKNFDIRTCGASVSIWLLRLCKRRSALPTMIPSLMSCAT